MNLDEFKFTGKKTLNLKKLDTSAESLMNDRKAAFQESKENLYKMQSLQNRLYSEGKESLLIIFQAMDAAGKDSAIKHVMSGVNPQGIMVHNFKQPTSEEIAHDYLWRAMKVMPKRGMIGIFNRSYYEDVLIGKVHKTYENQNLPDRCKTENIIEQRYKDISNYEKYLWHNGIRVIKFFLNLSRNEQKRRFFRRIDDPSKNWKLSESDIKERKHWDEYMDAYECAINATAKPYAPWYVVPADRKWFARYFISTAILQAMEEINPQYPVFPQEKKEMLIRCKGYLIIEDEIKNSKNKKKIKNKIIKDLKRADNLM